MAQLGTRKLKIEVDGDDFTADVSNARFTSGGADTDFLSFAQANAGGSREYRLQGTAAQDLVVAALWRITYESPGDEIAVVLMPYGNATPTATEPHVSATCIVAEPDGDWVGGEANASPTSRMTFELNWLCTARPVLVVS